MNVRISLTIALVLLVSGCFGRSDNEIAQQRKSLEDVLAQVPLPAGSTADRPNARYDKGCQGFAECADAGDKEPVYQVPITGAPADLSGACRYFADGLRGLGFTLVAVWRGDRITSATSPDLSRYPELNQGSGLKQRWIDVGDAACGTGKLTSAVVVKEDGSPLNSSAFLELALTGKNGVVSPSYGITLKTPPQLPVRNAPMTESELAHVRGVLDRQFVLAASPATDGIEAEPRGAPPYANWDVPAGIAALRFRYRCSAGDEATFDVRAITESASPTRAESRTVDCTGESANIDFARPASKVRVQVGVRKRPASPTGSPQEGFGPFTVDYVPVR